MDARLASQFSVPTGKQKVLLQFNKLSKELVSVITWVDPTTLNAEYFVYFEAQYDYDNDVVIGNADKYEIVDKSTQPIVVYESAMDEMAAQKITDKYTVTKQINIIGKAIQLIASKITVTEEESDVLEALEEMIDYVNEIKRSNEQRKRLFRESPEYTFISVEDSQNALDRQLEGGLHEAIGGRTVTGGRVF